MRTLTLDDSALVINGKKIFQRLVLDQGFYPDGIYTAPTDEALRGDIELSMAMGFNGARLHQKVFEQRFLYWADRLGYLCWGEMPSWGIDPSRPHTMTIFLREWLEVVARDFNAPCIVSSGIRCKSHNQKVGGVADSRHLSGKAMDFRIQGKTALETLSLVQKLPGVRYAYAIDRNYVHMDVK